MAVDHPAYPRSRKPATGLKKIVEGVKGLAKAATGQEPVPPEVLTMRLATCEACELRKGQICIPCGCYIPAKARLASSECPVGKWLAVKVV